MSNEGGSNGPTIVRRIVSAPRECDSSIKHPANVAIATIATISVVNGSLILAFEEIRSLLKFLNIVV